MSGEKVEASRRDNLFSLKGFSRDRQLILALSSYDLVASIKELERILDKTDSCDLTHDIDCWISDNATLQFYVKADDRFYNVCVPDGSCAWQLASVMKDRGKQPIPNRDNCLRMGFFDLEIKGTLVKNTKALIGKVQSYVEYNMFMNIHDFVERANAYISFLENYDVNNISTQRLSKWLNIDAIPYICDDSTSFCIFATERTIKEGTYLLLDMITSFGVKKTGNFSYRILENICADPNFSAFRHDHCYPLPSANITTSMLIEAKDELIDNIAKFGLSHLLELLKSLRIKGNSRNESRNRKNSAVYVHSDGEVDNLISSENSGEDTSSVASAIDKDVMGSLNGSKKFSKTSVTITTPIDVDYLTDEDFDYTSTKRRPTKRRVNKKKDTKEINTSTGNSVAPTAVDIVRANSYVLKRSYHRSLV